jgi:membrane protein YdbS with pleckstrin-like domain
MDPERVQAADPAQRDLAWVGYHPRAAAPLLFVAAFVTALVLSGRWYLAGLADLADRVGALAVFALACAVWPGLLLVFLYRAVTYTYRLTDRAILADFGHFSKPVPPIPLEEVAAVTVSRGWVSRWLDVGAVEVRTKNRILRMPGVRRPGAFADKIRTNVYARKAGIAE